MTREPCPHCNRPEATRADWADTKDHPPGCRCERCCRLCWGGQGCRNAAETPPPADAALLAMANREILDQLEHAKSAEGILTHLRANPDQAFAVARQLRAAGPWEPDSYDQPISYHRRTAQGGSVSSHGTSARMLERADERLRREGYILVGGLPDDMPPRCGEVHVGWRFGERERGLPGEEFVCDEPAGHHCTCRRDGLCAFNAMARRAEREAAACARGE
jgi:hypothetical protein